MFDVYRAKIEGCLYRGLPARYVTDLKGQIEKVLFVVKSGDNEVAITYQSLSRNTEWKNLPKEYWANAWKTKKGTIMLGLPKFNSKEAAVEAWNNSVHCKEGNDYLGAKLIHTEP